MCWDKEEAQEPGKLSTQQSFSPTYPRAELSHAKILLKAGVGGAIRQRDESRSRWAVTCRRQEGSSRVNLDGAFEKKTTFLVNVVGHMCSPGLIEGAHKMSHQHSQFPTSYHIFCCITRNFFVFNYAT